MTCSGASNALQDRKIADDALGAATEFQNPAFYKTICPLEGEMIKWGRLQRRTMTQDH